MRVMYEGIGSPCDECMYECGSSGCDVASSCAELVVVDGSIKFHESVFYYHVSQEIVMNDLNLAFAFWCLMLVVFVVLWLKYEPHARLREFLFWLGRCFKRKS